MATNKFATMLYRNTNEIVVILVYAFLEWILIILLLVNSLFSYLITKFSNYFGLKPPCVLCSRVDRFLEPGKITNSFRDLVCETHAAEVSKLSYCSTHQKLAETHNMCDDCLGSRPGYSDSSLGRTQRISFIPWESDNHFENGEMIFRCSCCNESLGSKLHPSFWFPKPSFGALDFGEKDNIVIEAVDDDNSQGEYTEPSKSNSASNHKEEDNEIHEDNWEENGGDDGIANEHKMLPHVGSFCFFEAAPGHCSTLLDSEQDSGGTSFLPKSFDGIMYQRCSGQDESLEMINMHLEDYITSELSRLIPVELIDSSTTANQVSCSLEEDNLKENDDRNIPPESEAPMETSLNVLTEEVLFERSENAEKATEGQSESPEIGKGEINKDSTPEVVERKEDTVSEACREVHIAQETPDLSLNEGVAVEEPDDLAASGTSFNLPSDETTATTLIGKEASDHAAEDQPEDKEGSSLSCLQHQPSTINDPAKNSAASDVFVAQNDLGPSSMGKSATGEENILIEKTQEGINNHASMPSEPNEAEEEKFPDTPTSVESLHCLHKKLLLFEKREPGAEESLDGSVVSEMEGGDPVNTMERLKAELASERKALNALYAELEEERSASAIAANQTMAMITRLQEEKAAMQMEALQYQRMMEEQAEYDQEALQLLNELMVKREKEKKELEKELEIFRQKVLDYETKEKMRIMRRIKNGSLRSRNSSASCSNADDSDELSIDLNREAKDEDSSSSGHQDSSQNNSPDNAVLDLEEMALDCVKHMSALDESLVEYEEERLSILDQLKALEEKLITLGDNEGDLEDGKSVGNSSTSGAKECEDHDFTSPEENGISNGFHNDKHYTEGKSMSSMAKRLLPLLDATNIENEEGLLSKEKGELEYVEMQNSLVPSFELDTKKLAIEDEVDHVYERLQALEADREFLKHCMGSIKKGDKGMDLLQEILQHLRDLKAVEIRVKNMADDPED